MKNVKIAIIGLGYVGLPLAVEFAKKYVTTGYDIDSNRVQELLIGRDRTLEVTEKELQNVLLQKMPSGTEQMGLFCTSKLNEISQCTYYIITVPTPVDTHNHPDLIPLYKASEAVGTVLKKNDIVIYESTVYPGVTEEECAPILERKSGLELNKDFFVGYSPERINPGDKEHTVSKIKKITSGSSLDAAEKIDQLYKSIITAGTHKATSIKVAEAAKVIENSQRDINIAFVNELAKIFNHLNVDTYDVLEAANTKWNFLNFKPGLVGGHCIGVDPYYLAQKAQEKGYHPEIILAGRRLNDGMGCYVAQEMVKLMIKKGVAVNNSKVLILGFTFKENCPDIRNTRIIDIVRELISFHVDVFIFDPWVDPRNARQEYGVTVLNDWNIVRESQYNGVILAVAHTKFREFNLQELRNGKTVVYDLKGYLERDQIDARL